MLDGGTIGRFLVTRDGSTVFLDGGFISGAAGFAGDLVMTDGGLGAGSQLSFTGSAVVSGGAIGWGFEGLAGSTLELVGADFRLNGAPIAPGTLALSDSAGPRDLLTGVFSDGTPFALSPQTNNTFPSITLSSSGVPSVDTTPLVVTTGFVEIPGLRAGQSVRVNGGILSVEHGPSFTVLDSTINVLSGTVTTGFELIGSVANIRGGSIGSFGDSNLGVLAGSELNLSGGSLSNLWVGDGGVANVSGGQVAFQTRVLAGGVLNLRGGTTPSSGIDLLADSTINFIGREFFLDGVPVPSTDGLPIDVSGGGVLTGTLLDGTAVTTSTLDLVSPLATITVTLVPEPTTAVLVTTGAAFQRRRKRGAGLA